jgi:hypothetical protein
MTATSDSLKKKMGKIHSLWGGSGARVHRLVGGDENPELGRWVVLKQSGGREVRKKGG